MNDSRVIVPPPGCSCDNSVGYGLSSAVYYDKHRNEIIKAPQLSEDRPFIDVENEIYKRLSEGGQHDGLLEYRGSEIYSDDNRTAIRLEWAPNDQLRFFLEDRS